MIAMDFIVPVEASDDGSIEDDGDTSDEDYKSALGESGVRTGVTGVGTKEVEEGHQAVKYSFLLSYMLKPPPLQGGL